MKLVKWNKFGPIWPSFFEDDDLNSFSNWPDLSSSKGLDIYETENSVVVEAALPGIPEDNVEVTIEGNVLTISGEHEESEEDKKKKKYYKSTKQTSFSYSTSLPRMVDGTMATAEVENGVVKITVPKAEEEKPKKIAVKKIK